MPIKNKRNPVENKIRLEIFVYFEKTKTENEVSMYISKRNESKI